jgi:hypothetical protein
LGSGRPLVPVRTPWKVLLLMLLNCARLADVATVTAAMVEMVLDFIVGVILLIHSFQKRSRRFVTDKLWWSSPRTFLPLNWMYPHFSPQGLIMKINRQPFSDLPEVVVQGAGTFWG